MKLRHFFVLAFVLTMLGYLADGGSPVVDGTSRTPAGTGPSPTPTAQPPDEPPAQSPEKASATTALAVLDRLPVKGRAPMTGYDRARFGPAWLDADRNGCDTRNDLLAEHLGEVVLESNGCVVASGVYADPFTGRRIDYWQGHGALIDLDHVVAMGNAWATGAFRWSVLRRAAFANDPLNLLPADAGANRQKGDGDAATWLPAHKPFRCAYVARQVSVKAKYALWVTAPEKAAVARVLAGCPGEPPTEDRWDVPTEVDHRITDPRGPGDATPGSAVSESAADPPVRPARTAAAAPAAPAPPPRGRH